MSLSATSLSRNAATQAVSTDIPNSDRAALMVSAPPVAVTTVTIDLTDDAPPPVDFRLTLIGCARINFAAENTHFRKKKALVYAFLEVHDVELDELGILTTCTLRCTHCLEGRGLWVVTKKSGGSTKNFNDHMAVHHSGLWEKAKKKEAEALGINSKESGQREITTMMASSTAFDMETFWDKIGQWIVLSNQPFTEIESEELRSLLCYLKPALYGKIVGADQLREKIIETAYTKYRDEFKQYLKRNSVAIPISCDAWTSSNNYAFLALTGSWITDEWELETALLDFIELHGAHTGQNMADGVFQSLLELSIVKKVIAQTTDSASNNNTLFSALSDSIAGLGNDSVLWNASESQIRCLSHYVLEVISGASGEPKFKL